MVGAMATLGDIVSPRERGRYMGYMMVVMMLATIGGPLLGGFITTSFSWRWIFYINIPLGGAALVYLLAVLHVPTHKVKHKVDYLGGTLLAVAATALILLATWGGTQYAWASVPDHRAGPAHRGLPGRVLSWSRPGRPSRCCRCTCSATGTSRWPW